jgi:predicted nucleic acid-binding Zn ribbon protein
MMKMHFTCAVCSAPFLSSHANALYCSNRCKQHAQRARRKFELARHRGEMEAREEELFEVIALVIPDNALAVWDVVTWCKTDHWFDSLKTIYLALREARANRIPMPKVKL